MIQPDDPGQFALTCLRCGEPEAFGPLRMCARHQPEPAPFWAHLLRWVPCIARRWL